jgi:adenosylcobinamide-phosphate synthase
VGEVLMAIVVFYCLAGTTLFREVRDVFLALDRSLDEGRQQVARIVGRDTSQLSAQEVRTAALETLAENLSDGVVAPLFWFALLGAPGMLAYKMVNTLDSMIGYRTERYRDFGCWAARIDDVANYIPARLTALLMIISKALIPVSRESRNLDKLDSSTESSGNKPKKKLSLIQFIRKFGRCHASPNSGYPEAALAGILDCRFGGPHIYFGELIDKPYIGTNDRPLTTADLRTSLRICFLTELFAVAAVVLCEILITL